LIIYYIFFNTEGTAVGQGLTTAEDEAARQILTTMGITCNFPNPVPSHQQKIPQKVARPPSLMTIQFPTHPKAPSPNLQATTKDKVLTYDLVAINGC